MEEKLKTLRDFEGYIADFDSDDGTATYHRIENGEWKEFSEICDLKGLREEAIKWIKYLKFKFGDLKKRGDERFNNWSRESLETAERPDLIKEAEYKIAKREQDEAFAQIEFIKHFFNLKSEDLK